MSRIIKAGAIEGPELQAWKPASSYSAKAVRRGNTAGSGSFPARDFDGHEAETPEQIAEMRLEAEQARKRAIEEGLAEGRELARRELEAKQAELKKTIEEMEAERTQFFDRMESEVTRLAVTIAEKVLAHELETKPEIVVDLVRNSMKRMRDRETLRVRVNPEDLPLVRAARDELMSEVNGVQKLDLTDDRRVGRGGCVIESSNGILDARVKTQLEEIERVIGEAVSHGKAGGTE